MSASCLTLSRFPSILLQANAKAFTGTANGSPSMTSPCFPLFFQEQAGLLPALSLCTWCSQHVDTPLASITFLC